MKVEVVEHDAQNVVKIADCKTGDAVKHTDKVYLIFEICEYTAKLISLDFLNKILVSNNVSVVIARNVEMKVTL